MQEPFKKKKIQCGLLFLFDPFFLLFAILFFQNSCLLANYSSCLKFIQKCLVFYICFVFQYVLDFNNLCKLFKLLLPLLLVSLISSTSLTTISNGSSLRSKTAVLTDSRIRTMNEVVSGIRIIKMYAWEKPFAGLIADVRR